MVCEPEMSSSSLLSNVKVTWNVPHLLGTMQNIAQYGPFGLTSLKCAQLILAGQVNNYLLISNRTSVRQLVHVFGLMAHINIYLRS